MRTARAHNGRSCGNCLVDFYGFACLEAELLGNDILAELAYAAEELLAFAGNADILAEILNDIVEFFNYNDFTDRCGKFLHLFCRQGIYHTELENRILFTADFLDILIGGR